MKPGVPTSSAKVAQLVGLRLAVTVRAATSMQRRIRKPSLGLCH